MLFATSILFFSKKASSSYFYMTLFLYLYKEIIIS